VDTHVHRIATRLGFVNEKSAEKTSQELEKLFTPSQKVFAHHAMILF
jgi:endonuclease III